MNDEQEEIFYLSLTSATVEYAKLHGAQYDQENGWHVVGSVPFELEEFVVRLPRKREHNIIVYCPLCGGQMRLVDKGPRNIFWGCMRFPKCKGARNVEETEDYGEAKPVAEFSKQSPVNKNNGADAELTGLAGLALKKLGSPKSVERWFATPKAALSGKRPVDVMKSSEGREVLIDMLNKINE